jgi:uncharacterized lipoprotein YbaY
VDDKKVRIDGVIAIEPPVDLDGAEVEVLLRDSAMADAPSRIIARTMMHRSGYALNEIAFRLEARVDPHRRYCIAAEVRRGAVLQPGDLLSVAARPWRLGDEGPITIEVKRIR